MCAPRARARSGRAHRTRAEQVLQRIHRQLGRLSALELAHVSPHLHAARNLEVAVPGARSAQRARAPSPEPPARGGGGGAVRPRTAPRPARAVARRHLSRGPAGGSNPKLSADARRDRVQAAAEASGDCGRRRPVLLVPAQGARGARARGRAAARGGGLGRAPPTRAAALGQRRAPPARPRRAPRSPPRPEARPQPRSHRRACAGSRARVRPSSPRPRPPLRAAAARRTAPPCAHAPASIRDMLDHHGPPRVAPRVHRTCGRTSA